MNDCLIGSEDIGGFWVRMRLVSNVLQDVDRKLAQHIAHKFNIFDDIFESALNENKISDIIAWLLDPKGTHGQQELFLRLFMQELQLSRLPVTGQIDVFREKTTTAIESSLRRVDIVVLGNEWVVGIENKPWAMEREDQISDYQLYLSRIGKQHAVVVFISGYNIDALSVDETSATQYILLRYTPSAESIPCKTFINWLNNCVTFCEAESVRWFLRQFSQYIENRF